MASPFIMDLVTVCVLKRVESFSLLPLDFTAVYLGFSGSMTLVVVLALLVTCFLEPSIERRGEGLIISGGATYTGCVLPTSLFRSLIISSKSSDSWLIRSGLDVFCIFVQMALYIIV